MLSINLLFHTSPSLDQIIRSEIFRIWGFYISIGILVGSSAKEPILEIHLILKMFIWVPSLTTQSFMISLSWRRAFQIGESLIFIWYVFIDVSWRCFCQSTLTHRTLGDVLNLPSVFTPKLLHSICPRYGFSICLQATFFHGIGIQDFVFVRTDHWNLASIWCMMLYMFLPKSVTSHPIQ